MAAATTDRPPVPAGRHWIVAAAVAVVLLALAISAQRAAAAMASVAAARNAAVLAVPDAAARAPLRALPDATVDTALAASPLRQRTVNVAMARAVAAGAPVGPWMAQLSRLGWRDTTALQNKLWAAAQANDLPAVMDTGDALLRRQELIEQVIPVLSLAEGDPRLRAAFAERLAARPNWRQLYLTTTGHLRTPEQLTARYQLLRTLRQRGSGLPRSEAEQNIRLMDQGGLPELGFALWQGLERGVTRPLDDTDFVRASASFQSGADALPFEWQMMSGEGVSVGATGNGAGATLDIDWDGRGVPVLARQRTSALPGAYRLDIAIAPEKTSELGVLDFSLLCADEKVVLRQDERRPSRFVTERPVPCAYPVLEIRGNIQSATTPHQFSIERIMLSRIGREG